MSLLSFLFAFLTLLGVVQYAIAARFLARFCAAPMLQPVKRPAVSIMKPLCGHDLMEELALESFFLLDYPDYQLVFGVQDAQDPVLEIIARLRARYPNRDTVLMVNDSLHGQNRKVSNLINMLPLAKHEMLVFSDADMHVPPYYLDDVVAAMEAPNTGLVTTLYTGLPAKPVLAARLGAAQINQLFLPGALLARKLGRQDCMGATMAIKKSVLLQSGGLQALVNHLADDQLLGRHVADLGYNITLARNIPAATVAEVDFSALFRHELRWARTIRALVPFAYAGSILQIPLFWALLTVLFSAGAAWSLALLLGSLCARVMFAQQIEAVLRLPRTRDVWLYLLRDLLSLVVYCMSFLGRRVDWRGQSLIADSGRPVSG